jgi:TonB family protein
MKFLTIIPLTFAFASGCAFAKTVTIFADVQVTDITEKRDLVWERKNQQTPTYPAELASSGIQGCAVLSFDISESGYTENVEIINSVPNKHIGKYTRKMLKKWRWVPVDPQVTAVAEKRTLRFDLCLGGDAITEAAQACKRQTELACQ